MFKSDNINELATALAKAQGELSDPKAAASNPFFNSHYATLSMVLGVVRSVFSKYQLSISQLTGDSDAGYVEITTLIMHASGQYIGSSMKFPLGKKDAQGVGSAITYGRRYMLAAAAGIAQDDDDGNAAVDEAGLRSAAANKGLTVNATRGGSGAANSTGAAPAAPPVNPNQGKGPAAGAPAARGSVPPVLKCAGCGAEIKQNVYDFTMKNYGRPLCFSCQHAVQNENARRAGQK